MLDSTYIASGWHTARNESERPLRARRTSMLVRLIATRPSLVGGIDAIVEGIDALS